MCVCDLLEKGGSKQHVPVCVCTRPLSPNFTWVTLTLASPPESRAAPLESDCIFPLSLSRRPSCLWQAGGQGRQPGCRRRHFLKFRLSLPLFLSDAMRCDAMRCDAWPSWRGFGAIPRLTRNRAFCLDPLRQLSISPHMATTIQYPLCAFLSSGFGRVSRVD